LFLLLLLLLSVSACFYYLPFEHFFPNRRTILIGGLFSPTPSLSSLHQAEREFLVFPYHPLLDLLVQNNFPKFCVFQSASILPGALHPVSPFQERFLGFIPCRESPVTSFPRLFPELRVSSSEPGVLRHSLFSPSPYIQTLYCATLPPAFQFFLRDSGRY